MQNKLIISPGKIIILNGPSSSGKTTLAIAMQEQLEIPFMRFSFDLFRDNGFYPFTQIKSGKFSWEQIRPSVFRGLHQCLPALATAGNNIIFEHIIENKAWLNEIAFMISSLDVFFVRINCSLPELERREIQRGDRRPGEARQDFFETNNLFTHDFDICSEQPLEDNVLSIINSWKSRKRPSALDRVLEEANDKS